MTKVIADHGEIIATSNKPKNQTPLIERLRGKNFKELLKSRGLTKYRVAKETGINYRTLQYWESGERPSEKYALKVAKYLGLTDEVEFQEMKKEMEEILKKAKRWGIK